MTFSEFERMARRVFDEVPPEYRAGIDGLVVSRDTEEHPTLPDVFTLGYCDTEEYPSDWVGPDTLRSVIVLFWGSFRRLAVRDPDFDWESEIRETIEHEILHHLEGLAGEDDLEDVDYAAEQSVRRERGESWDPWYWQSGTPSAAGGYQVEDERYLEVVTSQEDFYGTDALDFTWRGERYRIDRPRELGDLHFVEIVGGVPDAPRRLEIVVVRKRGWWEGVRRFVRRTALDVLESEARAWPAEREKGGG